jgi:superfamily II DNA helicase RecQ
MCGCLFNCRSLLRLYVLCSCVFSFGMGIDHAETRIIVNYGLTKNLESLVQMTGRAGRDGQPATCTMFFAQKDYAMVSAGFALLTRSY